MPYIKEACVDNIKDSIDIVKIVGQFVELQQTGSTFKGLSPFTNERTPSFFVIPSKQIFKCFSSGKGGGAINFLMELRGFTYPQALEWIAKLNNVELEYDDSEEAQERVKRNAERDELRKVAKAAANFYHQQLLALDDDHPAWKEMAKRGYDRNDALEYGIGYAKGGTALVDKIRNVPGGSTYIEMAMQIGLVNEDHKDKLAHRLTFSISDHNELLVGLAGRYLGSKPNYPKWVNPKESLLYSKESVLYGLNVAMPAISAKRQAIIVEGYNDVIAFHKNGLQHTVGSCGTAIATKQIRLLKKYCTSVILAMDPDDAGKRSTLKYIPLFLKEELLVQVLILSHDPDEFCREKAEEIQLQGLEKMIEEPGVLVDGFRYLADSMLNDPTTGEPIENEFKKNSAIRELIKVVRSIPDKFHQVNYEDLLLKLTGISAAKFKAFVKAEEDVAEQVEDLNKKRSSKSEQMYHLPKGAELRDVQTDIERYGLFMHNNQVWVKSGEEPPYSFRAVSNFQMEVLMHIKDRSMSRKLIKITNVLNQVSVNDVSSADLNTLRTFVNVVTNEGKYQWWGGPKEHQQLVRLLIDRMGVGHQVDLLGWQNRGFWCWVNRVIVPGQLDIEPCEHGTFELDGIHYYIPAANTAFKDDEFSYGPEKRLRYIAPKVMLTDYLAQIKKVHREHSINAILITLGAIFLDHIITKADTFPIMYLYGPPSTGKDNLLKAIMVFFGDKQSAINLKQSQSTGKGSIRKMAQIRNILTHFSEFTNDDPKVTGLIQGIWDRDGYTIGAPQSKYKTEDVPIHQVATVTGNVYPKGDALISRLLIEEMTKKGFTAHETEEFFQLKKMMNQGISGLTSQIIQFRKHFEENFGQKHELIAKEIREIDVFNTQEARFAQNISILGAVYKSLEERIIFPFSFAEFLDHNVKLVKRQITKMEGAHILHKWWDCFLACVRTHSNPLVHGKDFQVKNGNLYIRWTLCFMRVSQSWYGQYNQAPPTKEDMSTALRESDPFIDLVKSERFGGTNTSAFVFALDALEIKGELEAATSKTSYGETIPEDLTGSVDEDNLPF